MSSANTGMLLLIVGSQEKSLKWNATSTVHVPFEL